MKNLDQTTQRRLETVAAVIVPGFAGLCRSSRDRFLEIIDDALGDRPESMRRQLAIFLKILDVAPIFRWRKTLGRLEPDKARGVLRWFQETRIHRLRQGFWGLKTLVFMGYYGRPQVWPELGYAPEIGGPRGCDD